MQSFEPAEVEGLLGSFKDGSRKEYRPSVDPTTGGVTYAEAHRTTGLGPTATRRALERLSEGGILKKGAMETFHACPRCSSKLVITRLRCPYCRGGALTGARAIEHFRCGNVDIDSAFSSSGRTICPQCKKELKALGVDYRYVINQHGCLTCGRLVREPRWSFVCLTCGEKIPQSEVRFERHCAYTLDPGAWDKLSLYAPTLTPLRPLFEKYGFHVKFDAPVKGKSGVEHNFTIAAWRQKGKFDEAPDLLLKFVHAEEPVSVRSAMSIVGETVDVGGKSAIIVAVPGLSAEALKLAGFYGVAAWGFREAEDVPGELERLIPGELTRLGGKAGRRSKEKSGQEAKKADEEAELLLDSYRREALARERKERLESLMKRFLEEPSPRPSD